MQKRMWCWVTKPGAGWSDSTLSCFYASPGSTSVRVSCLSPLFFPGRSGTCRGRPSASSWGRKSWSWRQQCRAAGLHPDSNTWQEVPYFTGMSGHGGLCTSLKDFNLELLPVHKTISTSYFKIKVSPSDHVWDSLGESSFFERLVDGLDNLPAQNQKQRR